MTTLHALLQVGLCTLVFDLLLRHLPLLVPIAVGLIAWAGPLHRECPGSWRSWA